jgi:hypothetical protein
MLRDGLDHRTELLRVILASRRLANLGASIGNSAGNPFGQRATGVIAEEKRGCGAFAPIMFLDGLAE